MAKLDASFNFGANKKPKKGKGKGKGKKTGGATQGSLDISGNPTWWQNARRRR